MKQPLFELVGAVNVSFTLYSMTLEMNSNTHMPLRFATMQGGLCFAIHCVR